VIEKSRKFFLTRVKKYIGIKKQCCIKRLKCPLRSATHAFALFLMFRHADRVKSFCSDGNGSPDETLSAYLIRENRQMYP
jgi:hypothetical protein